MPRWLVLVLAVPLAIGACLILYWMAMGFLYFAVTNVFNAGHEKRVAEARAFGRSHTAEDCIAEALRRADRCGEKDSACVSRASDFLAFSIGESKGSREVCATVRGVPREEWLLSRCGARGRFDHRCRQVMSGILVSCPQ